MNHRTEQACAEPDVAWEQPPCPLCGEEQSTFVLTAHDWQLGYPGDFQLVRCHGCLHVYLDPRPTQESLSVFYPSDYGPYQAGADPNQQERPAQSDVGILRRVVRWFVDTCGEFIPPITNSPRRALELGCANGNFLLRLQNEGWDVQGIDFSEQAAQRACERGLDVHHGTLETAQLPPDQFDAVFLWMVLEHLYDPRETLKEIHRVLKPDGWLVFSVPNFASWERRLCGRHWYALELPRHLHHFSIPILQRLLQESGFEEIRIIHQRTVNSIVGSLGYWLQEKYPQSKLAQKLITYCDEPRAWAVILLALPAKLFAWLHQSGRITVIARPKQLP